VEALVDMVVCFIQLMTEGASVVESRFAFADTWTTGELFPSELIKEFAVTVKLSVYGGEGVPIDGCPGRDRPMEASSVIKTELRSEKTVLDSWLYIASDGASINM
jgi:hypothetical protein